MIHTQVLSSLINSQIKSVSVERKTPKKKAWRITAQDHFNIITNFKKYNKKNGNSV